ncbi:MAG: hypothetical protein LBF05_06320 [Tannerella sp.]|jgi:hypothetical protein|nr:hypothetical protein [Tannerella sp.]
MNTFQSALTLTENLATRTPITIQAKNDARKAAEKKVRDFLKAYVTYNPPVTNADRKAMEVPIHKKTRDHSPIATTWPWVFVSVDQERHLRFDFQGSETSKAKLDGQHGMELVGQIGGEMPTDQNKMPLSFFDTNSPMVIDFLEEYRGEDFYFSYRWENNVGEKGPWSNIFKAIIP